jgi:hypothetical protein
MESQRIERRRRFLESERAQPALALALAMALALAREANICCQLLSIVRELALDTDLPNAHVLASE